MAATTFGVASGITAIDTLMAGRERYTAAYLIASEEPAIVETGPTTSVEPVVQGLATLGIGPKDLTHIVVTHIHLDHAGGVGRLASRFPRATIWVHERGAPHLADPTRLVASAKRIYGPEGLARLFGPVDPVPPDRLRALVDGDRLPLGNRSLDVLSTPGHASHHVALVDEETGATFTGDALGIHPMDLRILWPATPPPDFDVELAVSSIDRIRSLAPSILLFAHFGPVAEIDRICELAIQRIRKAGEVVRIALRTRDDLDGIAEILERETMTEIRSGADAPLDLARLETLSSARVNAMGLIRYWKKRAEREASANAPPEALAGEAPQSQLS